MVNLKAVDGRRARCRDSIHQLVSSKQWDCDKVTLSLKLWWRTGWWRLISWEVLRKQELHSAVHSKSSEWWDYRHCGVYAVLSLCCTGVCCTRWMLYSVYTVIGVCCTLCILLSVYAALSVNSWWWHGEIERDGLTLCFCDDGIVVDKKEREGEWRWEQYGRYNRLWEIRNTAYLNGFKWHSVGIITRRIWTHTCHIGHCQLTHTQSSLKSQFLMMIASISSDLSLSCAQLYNHPRKWSKVIPLYLSMP